ncbi:hypothetical protein Msil_2098 [Methylocella silvestris BL2]|uniref:Uncharacterized protein n=1 Tax=Methylocella silvestris (strain DSM 15510 / CIP 108128 / LMG 27833 / NCIMB 13906 / BL2) TaxID=395965 RepID=B8ERI5_METSB|nr:hypothetical protein [Methylocella silvestris]ACK51037.1 hypothetical protein Msil_2098 [Methylocella silvestris BL2]
MHERIQFDGLDGVYAEYFTNPGTETDLRKQVQSLLCPFRLANQRDAAKVDGIAVILRNFGGNIALEDWADLTNSAYQVLLKQSDPPAIERALNSLADARTSLVSHATVDPPSTVIANQILEAEQFLRGAIPIIDANTQKLSGKSNELKSLFGQIEPD